VFSSDLPGVNPATLNRMILYYLLMTKWSGLGDSTELSRLGLSHVPPGSRLGASPSIAGDNFQHIFRSHGVCLHYSVNPSLTDALHGPPSSCTRPWCLYGCSTASSSPAAVKGLLCDSVFFGGPLRKTGCLI
jgi:hypothetical protein